MVRRTKVLTSDDVLFIGNKSAIKRCKFQQLSQILLLCTVTIHSVQLSIDSLLLNVPKVNHSGKFSVAFF